MIFMILVTFREKRFFFRKILKKNKQNAMEAYIIVFFKET